MPTGGSLHSSNPGSERRPNRAFLIGLARAFGGAILFSLPMMMTMEMWHLGFYSDRVRLAILLILLIPLLVGLSYYSGFEETFGLKDNSLDALVAFAVGFIASGAVLLLFGIIEFQMRPDEIIGKISLQAVPGSIGAILARSQLGEREAGSTEGGPAVQYGGELFQMGAGALFLSLNVAPTEEMVLIAYKMTFWHVAALALVSLITMHAFVYGVEFRGHPHAASEGSIWSLFLRFTIVGYALVLLISFYILWTFGRTDGLSIEQSVAVTIVLSFPASVGAAAARLLL